MELPSPPEKISQMLTGYWISQALYVAAKLGLADLLVDGPRAADDLAKRSGTHAPSLYRLLRALASVGVFAEQTDRRFALTPLAECLRSDRLGSQRALAIMAGEEHFRAWSEFLSCIQTGKPAFDRVYKVPVFDFLSRNPEQAKVFDAAMVGVHGRETAAMLDAYDFAAIGVLADIGGGNGSLLTAALKRHSAMRGILYDLPGVIERARTGITAAGLADRCQLIAGNFFESVPPGADAYLMRHIIHDWDDDQSLRILQNIYQAMGPRGKLLLVEGVVPPGNEPSFTKLLDLNMLAIPGGKERTEPEYRKLFETAGFRLTQIVPTNCEVSVIEGEKA
jgi:SAM-dependent methyltransferase